MILTTRSAHRTGGEERRVSPRTAGALARGLSTIPCCLLPLAAASQQRPPGLQGGGKGRWLLLQVAQSCFMLVTRKDFHLLGSTHHGIGQRRAGTLTAMTASRKWGDPTSPPNPAPSWGSRKDAEPPSLHPPPQSRRSASPTETGGRDGEGQAAETGLEVTSLAKNRRELQYK